MKKDFLLIAAAATMLAACVNLDTLQDYNTQQDGENDGSIGFTSFAENATKGQAENSEALYTWTFYNHQESFKVWGRKAGQATHEIFDGTTVTVAEDAGVYTYTYSPARFWDKSATKYHFYAAAPADDSWTFNGGSSIISNDATLGSGYFTTTVTLNGVNLQSTTNGGVSNAPKNVFKEATLEDGTTKDIDKLIAAPCEILNTYYNKAVPNAVNLNFIHILSKLNITISTSLYDATHPYDVDLLAFEVHNIPNTGSFDESTDGFVAHGKNTLRWTRTGSTTTNILTGIIVDDNNTPEDDSDDTDTHVDVASPTAANTTGAKKYIVESLIMPQNIAYERVALDGSAHAAVSQEATYFTTWAEYTQAKPVEAITEDEFNEIITAKEAGEATPAQLAKIENTPTINIPAYSAPTKPYFTITYSIDGDIFTQNFNLAAAFLGYTNNSQKKDSNGNFVDLVTSGENIDPTTFGFFEGWQNTLNIIINPTAIDFTADVAKWSDIEEKEFEIEQGNENPNN